MLCAAGGNNARTTLGATTLSWAIDQFRRNGAEKVDLAPFTLDRLLQVADERGLSAVRGTLTWVNSVLTRASGDAGVGEEPSTRDEGAAPDLAATVDALEERVSAC